MAQNSEATTALSETGAPASLAISRRGIKTAQDFSNVMSALMTDLLSGLVSPGVANAACNAGGKMLKAVEMQFKYGTKNGDEATNPRVLMLATDVPSGETTVQ